MSDPRDVVIIEGVRTPFVKSGTKFDAISAVELGQVALKELLVKTEISTDVIDEVIIGNTGNPSNAANISRVVALNAGLPQNISAHTVHRNCASALESLATGFDKIRAGQADTVIAGGTESMSNMPLLFTKSFVNVFRQVMAAKTIGQKLMHLGKLKLRDLKPRVAIMEGLTDPFSGLNMGQTAEVLAKEFQISREEQDEYALNSHRRAIQHKDRLREEIVSFFIPHREAIEDDVGPRENQSLEQLQKLRPYFDRKYGTVTVGNSCPITDGAAMVLMMNREKAEALGKKSLVKIKSYAFVGLEPERMGLGPVYATALALDRAGLTLKDIGLVELNEAFAAQVLSCLKAFESEEFAKQKLGRAEALGKISPEILNVNGGAIALGHPVGATGTRLVLTLMKEMERKGVQYGLATLCIGGGQGGAMILEREA